MDDESLTVTNVEASNHIPDDIVISILSKLPLKSFTRFGCVHKSRSLLFHEPYFMTKCINNFLSKGSSYYDDNSCLLVGSTRHGGYEYNPSGRSILLKLYSLSGDNFQNSVKIDLPKPFPHDETTFRIMDSTIVNGFLCLSGFHQRTWKLILWNPTTNEFNVIPPSRFEPEGDYDSDSDVTPFYHLFGYDRAKDDYKVIRFNDDDSGSDDDDCNFLWEIYSLKSNCWRTINFNTPLYYRNKVVYMDGVSHWWDKNQTHAYLVSFDFSNESFTKTPMPSFEVNNDLIPRDLVILNGSIAFILNYKKASTIYITILDKLGAKKSWTKLFVVGPSPYLNYPIVTAKKGKILFRSRHNRQVKHELVWFDLSTGRIDKIDVRKQIC